MWTFSPGDPSAAPQLLFDRSYEDIYSDPGSPLYLRHPTLPTSVVARVDGGRKLLMLGALCPPCARAALPCRLLRAPAGSLRLARCCCDRCILSQPVGRHASVGERRWVGLVLGDGALRFCRAVQDTAPDSLHCHCTSTRYCSAPRGRRMCPLGRAGTSGSMPINASASRRTQFQHVASLFLFSIPSVRLPCCMCS